MADNEEIKDESLSEEEIAEQDIDDEDLFSDEDFEDIEEAVSSGMLSRLSDKWQYPLFAVSMLVFLYLGVVSPMMLPEEKQTHPPEYYIEKARMHYRDALTSGIKQYTSAREKSFVHFSYLLKTYNDYFNGSLESDDYLMAGDVFSYGRTKERENLKMAHRFYARSYADLTAGRGFVPLDKRLYLLYRMGKVSYNLGDYTDTVEKYRRVVRLTGERERESLRMEKAPSDSVYRESSAERFTAREKMDVFFILAECLNSLGETREALRLYNLYIADGVKDARKRRAYLASGIIYFVDGDYKKAYERYREIIDWEGETLENMNVFARAGHALFKMGRPRAAVKYLEKVVNQEINENGVSLTPVVLLILGKSYFAMGRDLLALEMLAHLRRNYPNSFEKVGGETAVADNYLEKKEKKVAAHWYVRIMRDTQKNLWKKNPYVTEEYVVRRIEALAEDRLKAKNYADAVELYEAMLTYVSEDVSVPRDQVLFQIAFAHEKLDKFEKAAKACDRILLEAANTNFLEKAYKKSADLYYRAGLFARAYDRYKSFARIFYDSPELYLARYRLGLCARKIGRCEEALACFERNESKAPSNTYTYFSIFEKGKTYELMGKYEKAADVYMNQIVRDTLERFTPDSYIWRDATLELGKLKCRLGEYDQAVYWLTDFIERYPLKSYENKYSDSREFERGLFREMSEKHFNAGYWLGLSCFEQQQYDKARNIFRTLFKVEPVPDKEKLKYATIYIGDTYYFQKQYKDAIEAYREAMSTYMRDVEGPYIGFQIANCYRALKDYDSALREYKRASWAFNRLTAGSFSGYPQGFKKKFWQAVVEWNVAQSSWFKNN